MHHRCQRHRWQICRRCQLHRWQIAAGINNTGSKFATVINAIGGKFFHQFPLCCWHRWQICQWCQWSRRQICRRCQWRRWQIMGTISGCRHLKVNLKQKFIYMYYPKGVQTKLLKFFCLKIFSICYRCCWHRWCTLSHEYLREFSKKFEMAVVVYSEAWGKLIHEKKTRSWKSRVTVPLNSLTKRQKI